LSFVIEIVEFAVFHKISGWTSI